MRVRQLSIHNFRGIETGHINFAGHTLLAGGNNVGKSTICEALDLILGPERQNRRPVVDEHDFHRGRYLDENGQPVEIRLEAVLVDLPDELQRRFRNHLRRWSDDRSAFVDDSEGITPEAADAPTACWALPLVFIGRYDHKEDDFLGSTFFAHPIRPPSELEEQDDAKVGSGLAAFGRDYKRLCGFLFLRTLRTGARALSLQRGSLLDIVLRLGGDGMRTMWEDTIVRLRDLDPSIGRISQLQTIRDGINKRLTQFVALAEGDNATGFFASDLTREHLREVVRLFVSTIPSGHPVPFDRLGTGTLNLLVFALLTFIADLKGTDSVIFAMEEPEIALPPHTQRRVTRFILRQMGQCIVTSHSPYVIEQFQPEQLVIVRHSPDGQVSGEPVDLDGLKPKAFRTERRQLAEAILGRAVLVVEGSTEASLFPVAASVLERSGEVPGYMDFDLGGISVFDAGGDGAVARVAATIGALGKPAFAFYDKPTKPFPKELTDQLGVYRQAWESPEKGIENLLARELPVSVLRRFLAEADTRSDFPADLRQLFADQSDDQIRTAAAAVLKARKGEAHGYAALLVAKCGGAAELPPTILGVLKTIHAALNPA